MRHSADCSTDLADAYCGSDYAQLHVGALSQRRGKCEDPRPTRRCSSHSQRCGKIREQDIGCPKYPHGVSFFGNPELACRGNGRLCGTAEQMGCEDPFCGKGVKSAGTLHLGPAARAIRKIGHRAGTQQPAAKGQQALGRRLRTPDGTNVLPRLPSDRCTVFVSQEEFLQDV